MVKIRLQRGGAKKRPFYHIVVTDMRNARDGRYIERLGFFNPVAIGGEVPLRLDIERIEYWKGHGAQLSERVTNLVKSFNRHGEGQAPARAAPPVSKAKEAPKQTVPAGETGDQSAEAAPQAEAQSDENQAGAAE
ncbi:MAG: 30S ribosomal protein S16 [Salinisphaera sp.]|nr:30S ribosomal protein S16 [Salinisphaera sp.]|tara:strand:+ start:2822 stop:3226 length:405 start_codon:yes stop_codon:yes gene_type:complete